MTIFLIVLRYDRPAGVDGSSWGFSGEDRSVELLDAAAGRIGVVCGSTWVAPVVAVEPVTRVRSRAESSNCLISRR